MPSTRLQTTIQPADSVQAGPAPPALRVELSPHHVETRFATGTLGRGDSVSATAGCPVCGAGEPIGFTALVSTEGEAIVERAVCTSCSHIAFTRMPNQAWFRRFYAKEFETSEPPPVHPPKNDYSAVSDLLTEFVPTTATILDLGCGYGSALQHLQSLGYERLAGLEISERRAEVASSLGVPVARVTAEEMHDDPAIADAAPFDAVFSYHTFEHVFAPFDSLANVHRILRPGGIVMIAVPNGEAEHLLQMAHYAPHIHSYSEASIAALFERCGFDLVFIDSAIRAVGVKREDDGPRESAQLPRDADNLPLVRLRQKFDRDFGLGADRTMPPTEGLIRFSDYSGSRQILEPSHGQILGRGDLPAPIRAAVGVGGALGWTSRPGRRLAGRLSRGGPWLDGTFEVTVDDAPADRESAPRLTVRYESSDVSVWLK